VLYTLWAVLALLLLDFLVGLVRSFIAKTFSSNLVVEYLRNVLYHILPLLVMISLFPIDPAGWILLVFYYIAGLALILHYLTEIKNKWRA